MADNSDVQKQFHVNDFQQNAKSVLSNSELQVFYRILKEYQGSRRCDRLIAALKPVLNTEAKRDLILRLRSLIPENALSHYDRAAVQHHLVSVDKLQRHLVTGDRLHTAVNATTVHSDLNQVNNALEDDEKQPYDTSSLKRKQRNGTLPRTNNDSLTRAFEDLTVISFSRSPGDMLGFSIRGGGEHGLGIYVSQVDPSSAAEHYGLRAGDQILELNKVSLDKMVSSRAIKLLSSCKELELVIKRTGKIPGWRVATEKTSWFDVSRQQLFSHKQLESQQPRQSPIHQLTSRTLERRISLTARKRCDYLGFNIRGGSEFGLGIYVSRVDRGGLAHQKGIRPGDQVIEVNDKSFLTISHAEAVTFLKMQSMLVMIVKNVGHYPAYREMLTGYTWVEGHSSQSAPASLNTTQIEDLGQPDGQSSTVSTMKRMPRSALAGQKEVIIPHNSQFILQSPARHNNTASGVSARGDQGLEDICLENFESKEGKRPTEENTESSECVVEVETKTTKKSLKKRLKNTLSRSSGTRKMKDFSEKENHVDVSSYSGSMRKRGVFEKSFGSQIMHKGSLRGSNLTLLREIISPELESDELTAVMTYIKTYRETSDLSRLIQVLITVFDTPEKLALLEDIRSVIYPADISRYDNMIERYQRGCERSGEINNLGHPYDDGDGVTVPVDTLAENEVDYLIQNGINQRFTALEHGTSYDIISDHSRHYDQQIIQPIRYTNSDYAEIGSPNQDRVYKNDGDRPEPHGLASPIYAVPIKPPRNFNAVLDQSDNSSISSVDSAPIATDEDLDLHEDDHIEMQSYDLILDDDGPRTLRNSFLKSYQTRHSYKGQRSTAQSIFNSSRDSEDDFNDKAKWNTVSHVVVHQSNDDDVNIHGTIAQTSSSTAPVQDLHYSYEHETIQQPEQRFYADDATPSNSSLPYNGQKSAMDPILPTLQTKDTSNPTVSRSSSCSTAAVLEELNSIFRPLDHEVADVSEENTVDVVENNGHDMIEEAKALLRCMPLQKVNAHALALQMVENGVQTEQLHVAGEIEKMEQANSGMIVYDHGNEEISDTDTNGLVVEVPKSRKTLGLSISGGHDSRLQPEIKVETIYEAGIIAQDGRIKAGMTVLSVDGVSLESVTHSEAVDIIRTSFGDKAKGLMTFIVK